MAAFHGAELGFPCFRALQCVGRNRELFGGSPAEIDPITIHRRCAGGKAILFVMFVFVGTMRVLPEDRAILCSHTDDRAGSTLLICTQQENFIPPNSNI